jgi:hypothetical protein
MESQAMRELLWRVCSCDHRGFRITAPNQGHQGSIV